MARPPSSPISDADLAAYVDNGLDALRRAEIEAEAESDLALARRLAAHQALGGLLVNALAPVLDAPVPDRLTRTVTEANVLRPRFGRPAHRVIAWSAAIAASLMVGVLIGHQSVDTPLRPGAHGLQAAGGLARSLDRQLAADGGDIRIGISFQQRTGGTCRTFEMKTARLAGLACREGQDWSVPVLASAAPQVSAYRMAGSETPAAVLAEIDVRIVGEAFDRRAEEAARDRGWR